MANTVLIIHGWSDTSKSFHALRDFLATHGYQTQTLWLGDYISMDDDVRVADVARRMGQVIDAMQADGRLGAAFDVIVHSTGGLVVREWLTRRYFNQVSQCPMKRLLMLAPANYGSRLAATGKSMLGRVVKGYNNWFHTGQGMLNDLELGSPFQWALAQRDILRAPGSTDGSVYYGETGVWPFVITGTHPYTNLLRQIVNEYGADGTVRVCAANLNSKGLTIDFSQEHEDQAITHWDSRLEGFSIPLAVLPTRTHASIVDPARSERDNREGIAETEAEQAQLGEFILSALACKNFKQYQQLQSEWESYSATTAARHKTLSPADSYHQYLQVNFEVVDDQGAAVADYFLEFFSNTSKRSDDANVYLHTSVIEDVKVNSQNPAVRTLYFDYTDLMEGYYPMLRGRDQAMLCLSISAAAPGANISYFANLKTGSELEITLHLPPYREESLGATRWLQPNMTHFVRIILPRQPRAQVFRLTRGDQI